MDDNESINKLKEIIKNDGLYSQKTLEDKDYDEYCNIFSKDFNIKLFCKECGEIETIQFKNTLFNKISNSLGSEISSSRYRVVKEEKRYNENKIEFFQLKGTCVNDIEHEFYFYFLLSETTIQKIGQYPSIADLHSEDFKKYKKILSDPELKELKTALIMYTHGYGIGSYIHLRRIFEILIRKAYDLAIQDSSFDEEEYKKAHLEDKIKMLKDYLPKKLIEKKSIYSVLSKGVHELSEEECLKNYKLLKNVICLILDEELEKKEKKRREADIDKEYNKVVSEIS